MRLLLLLSLLLSVSATAQTTLGLSAYYPFESNLGDVTGEPTNLGSPEGAVDYDCGVRTEALLLTGPGDFVRIPGGASNNVNREFDDEDFSVSLYFKALGTQGEQYLLAKQDTNCSTAPAFFIRYDVAPRTITAQLTGVDGETLALTHTLTNLSCWQHLVLVRDNTRLRLFINGLEVADATSPQRVNVDNDGDLLIGASACTDLSSATFSGLIDELRIYGRALLTAEVQELYLFPDRILTPPTNLFLGQSIMPSVNSNCGATFSWTPVDPVASPTDREPTITPTTAGRRVFRLRIADDVSSCVARDSLVLQVIDPEDLDCNNLFVPKAFTPNGIGPVANETFGISNPFAIGTLISFEVYDRYGGQVFRSDDRFARWDGTFDGQPVNPGVMLWRAVYRCGEEELIRTGSVTILR
ncbi:LamG-like jellyroll fold domain-containing protein [Neolewinella maritima]|nr:LamG-like jellyroll fold domain-containing protein [Neolewinella maritima]